MKELVFRQSASGVFEPVQTHAKREASRERREAKRQAAKRREFWETLDYCAAAAVLALLVAAVVILPHHVLQP